jgi:hypothetical protein
VLVNWSMPSVRISTPLDLPKKIKETASLTMSFFTGILADTPEASIHFHSPYVRDMASSISSFAEPGGLHPISEDPFDFTPYMDQAPLTLISQSPMEMVHRFFVKLGARYVVVVDNDGICMFPLSSFGQCVVLTALLQTRVSSKRRTG